MNKHLQCDWSSAGFSLRITDLENTETLKLENIEGNIQEKFMKPAEQQLHFFVCLECNLRVSDTPPVVSTM